MACPACGSKTRTLRVHDEVPFSYRECAECGWDDYDQRALEAVRLDQQDNDDEVEDYEPETDC